MTLHRVTWVSTWTGTVNHHDPEPLDIAQAHLRLLTDRHPFTKYTLEPYTPAADSAAEPVTGRTVLGLSAARAGDQVTSCAQNTAG